MTYRVVFVCTANICRSPVAEKVFAAEAARAGLAVDVSSAAIGPWRVGEPADPRSVAVLQAAGYPTEHVARQVGPAELAADLVVALDHSHVRALRHLGAPPERIRLLSSFDPAAPPGAEIPDPYGYGPDAFAVMLGMVRAAVPGLIAYVASEAEHPHVRVAGGTRRARPRGHRRR
ncbi:low molecular weight protein-tyrosine-phosphatase [Pseudonocardia sp. CA-107938]|uniref:low molecular weight protein-tyrosine-phosphatase n=1 Tax=Pseudonocardia sp. CA-107938 TaxID=3240021 RepID=UPI003D94CF42